MPRAQIKDERTYQRLRDHDESEEKAARIANAAVNEPETIRVTCQDPSLPARPNR